MPALGTVPPETARRAAACATRSSSVSSRRRELEKLAVTLLPTLPEPPAELLSCLVVNATADHPTTITEQARAQADARVAELLTALREGEMGGELLVAVVFWEASSRRRAGREDKPARDWL